MTVVVQGIDHLQKLLASGDKRVKQACREVIAETVAQVGAESWELVPVDTGALKRSRVLKFPTSGTLVGSVTYGGVAAPYAVVQHENTDLWHPPKPPSKRKVGGAQGTGPVVAPKRGGAKYLEYPLKRAHKFWEAKLVRAINKKFAKP